MSNITLQGNCLAPFYDASNFGVSGGYQEGRLCSPLPINPDVICCLPCPTSQWIYADRFETVSRASAWLNVVGLILLTFLLSSYIVLPAAKTNKHYLNVCLIVACIFFNLGFIIPLASKSDQCYDGITPNDMHSDNSCAWSGAFLIAGGLSVPVWICLRAFSMFLQIVWGIQPGKKSFWLYQIIGWTIPAVLLTASLAATGVSYRFGHACHINHEHSIANFWGWIAALAGITVLIQIITIVYCLKVYLANLFASDDEDIEEDAPDLTPVSYNEKSGMSPASPTPSGPREEVHKKVTAREIYQEVKTVLYVQWRIIVLTFCMLIEVIFFAVTFLVLDTRTEDVRRNPDTAQEWLLCLVANGGDKNQCLSLTNSWMVSLSTISAVLILLSLIGISIFTLLFRSSILSAWREFFARHVTHRKTYAGSSKTRVPEIRHLGITSPTDSTAPLNTLSNGSGGSGSPNSAGAGAGGYYDVNSPRQLRPDRPDETPPMSSSSQGSHWHPNPNVQVAQREGIMRTLRAARARAQDRSSPTGTGTGSAVSPQQGSQYPVAAPYGSVIPPAQGSEAYPPTPTQRHELPPFSANKDYD